MKKMTIWILLIALLFGNSGCAYAAYKVRYSTKTAYPEIWTLPGMLYSIDSDQCIFPRSIEELDVEEFFCRYDEQLPLGEGIQVFLRVRYDAESSFLQEKNRIESKFDCCSEYFTDAGFDYYAAGLTESDYFAYAAISKSESLICYIYLQALPYEEIEIESSFVPEGYTGYGELKDFQS